MVLAQGTQDSAAFPSERRNAHPQPKKEHFSSCDREIWPMWPWPSNLTETLIFETNAGWNGDLPVRVSSADGSYVRMYEMNIHVHPKKNFRSCLELKLDNCAYSLCSSLGYSRTLGRLSLSTDVVIAPCQISSSGEYFSNYSFSMKLWYRLLATIGSSHLVTYIHSPNRNILHHVTVNFDLWPWPLNLT